MFMSRKEPFTTNELYHVYNRGVDKRKIFMDTDDYQYFKHILKLFNSDQSAENARRNFKKSTQKHTTPEGSPTSFRSKKLVQIEKYCLMPNHYHLLIRQLKKNGISLFLQKFGTGYTHFFNKKHKRSGVLFQGKTKSKHVEKDSYYEYLKMYIDFNPIDLIEPKWKEKGLKNHKKVYEFLLDYSWSSFRENAMPENYLKDLSVLEIKSLLEIEKSLKDLRERKGKY